jgi:DNA gyrase inhibitor GyrI
MIQVKNWGKHQHFKDRCPPWIKLYREILDDPDWHELSGDDTKILMSLWLLASEDETHQGLLPDIRRICFRLRIKESQLNQSLTRLKHWLIFDDIKPISSRYQDDAPETETEKRREDGFSEFWTSFPDKRKGSKGKCLEYWLKHNLEKQKETIFSHMVKMNDDWSKDGGQFAPAPMTYLNQKRWDGFEQIESGVGVSFT